MGDLEKPHICYILPEYNPDTGSHFFHLYEFLVAAAGELDVFVVIEKCKSRPAWPFRCYCQKFSFPLLRFVELLLILVSQRLSGRRYFYTHYSFYGAIASWLVTRILGGRAYYWNSGEPWKYERSWFEEAVFRFILRHVILVTHPSGLAEEYRRRYGLEPERIKIVPHYIAVNRFQVLGVRDQVRRKLGIAPDAKVVLFVHRLSRRKGAHLIPEIAAEVVKREKNVIFVIVGSGPEEENLKLKTKNLKLEPHMRFVGEVPQREIPAYFRAADVLLLPSEEEGFPHVLLEAMAARVPYVASDVGGVREVTPPVLQEYIVPSGDSAAFAEKILKLIALSTPEHAKLEVAEQGWVKQYDLQAVLPKLVKLFQS